MRRSSLAIVFVFLLGAAAGLVVAKKVTINPNEYVGKSPEDAAGASGSYVNVTPRKR